MNQPTDASKATLDHTPDTTGRDGAIDFAAKVEASHVERVLLDDGEASLPEKSVVVVSQLFTVDKDDLGSKIGALSLERVEQVFEGICGLFTPEGV